MLKEKWGETPKQANHRGMRTDFHFICEFKEPGVSLKSLPFDLPEDLEKFWSICETAVLFKDIEYGQWGLEIFSPEKAIVIDRSEKGGRPNDYRESDLIIGSFLGDSDLLIISCDKKSKSFGKVFISLPLDNRGDWPNVANSFSEFLEKYSLDEGDKYWEVGSA